MLSILTLNLYKSASKGSADVDKGCRIIARALRSKKLANKAASARSPASLPPTASYMTSSLGHAEVPQAVLLSICSRSPVCHVIWVCVTKRSFISCSKVSLTHMLSCLEFNSRLLYPGLLLSWTSLCIVFSDAPFVCVFLSLPPTTCVFEFWPFPFDFHFFMITSLFHFFFTVTSPSLLLSPSCVNICVPILFLSCTPRGSCTKD